MRCVVLSFFLFINSGLVHAQPTDTTLLNEVRGQLANKKATVSSVLTNKKYRDLHSHTSFRELIRLNAGTDILIIATSDEPGKKIQVIGYVADEGGKPVSGALVYLYQTDAKGWYAAQSPHVGGNEGDMRHARIFGYVRTDAKGKFELHTVKPMGYPQSDLPAHIHVHVWKEGYHNFINEFLFDDDERLVGNIREQSIRNRFIIARPEPAATGFDQQFSYQVKLRSVR